MAVLRDYVGGPANGPTNATGTRVDARSGSWKNADLPRQLNHKCRNNPFYRRIRRPRGSEVVENRHVSSCVRTNKIYWRYTPNAGCARVPPSSIMAPSIRDERPAWLRTPGGRPCNRNLWTGAFGSKGPRTMGRERCPSERVDRETSSFLTIAHGDPKLRSDGT